MASDIKPEPTENAADKRPKRVRTGCLTCRERHLKCDEAAPICQNCKKSSRECKRGIRLNFIDTQVESPYVISPSAQDWNVKFQDESRDIASEYRGGLSRYPTVDEQPALESSAFPNGRSSHSTSQSLPSVQTTTYAEPNTPASTVTLDGNTSRDHRASISTEGGFSTNFAMQTQSTSLGVPEPHPDARSYLDQAEETLFLQVFVEEVGLWMDSMDPYKHFSRLLPFHALSEPMLLHSFLACGARHLVLVNPIYHDDKALNFYDLATRGLLRTLQDPNRDTAICATTAVILNVYEIMSEKALQRMNHIAGARALIKECGWNARSTGIGAACFWLNVGMELLSCLHFNWLVAWDPDDWGVDMDFSTYTEPGREEVWTHRIVYIVGKIANFRASNPHYPDASLQDQQMRTQNRYNEWKRLKGWCDSWNLSVPRSMQPMAYLHPYQISSKSAFPEVWLIKRTTIVARLFYHTAMCLLAQICPIMTNEHEEMKDMQMSHSRQICGIVAHVKDRGVASVALRSLAIAAECLVVRREQEEVLTIFERIKKETGWRVDFVFKELKAKWGWNNENRPPQQGGTGSFNYNALSGTPTSLPPAMATPQRPPGFSNPLMTADFSSQNPPYQAHWVAPNQQGNHSHFFNM